MSDTYTRTDRRGRREIVLRDEHDALPAYLAVADHPSNGGWQAQIGNEVTGAFIGVHLDLKAILALQAHLEQLVPADYDAPDGCLLVDNTGDEENHWIYSAKQDAWFCTSIGDPQATLAEVAIEVGDIVAGRQRGSSFQGFDTGAASVIETFGVVA